MAEINWTNERRKLADLKPWGRNPRQISRDQAKRLAQSFEEFGQVETIAIGPDNSVYNGHQRLSVLLDKHGRGYEVEVRVSSRPLTEKEREKLTVYLHKGAAGDWNFDILANEFDFGELVDWGFSEKELLGNGFVADEPQGEDVGAQVDKAEELREKWGVETGQMWRLGEHRVICGDCTDRAVVERVMGGEKAKLAWFDPPFGISLKPQRGLTNEIENDRNEEARELWSEFLPILKDYLENPAHVFLCQGWTEFDWTIPLVREYFTVKSKIVWNKNVWGIGYFTRPKHEDIIYCWNGKPEKINDPVSDVWDVPRINAPEHAAEKPPALSEIAINHFSFPGDVVVDWFNGVGGSIIACERLGRKCRAVEISPAYVAVSIQRWVDMTGGVPELIDSAA